MIALEKDEKSDRHATTIGSDGRASFYFGGESIKKRFNDFFAQVFREKFLHASARLCSKQRGRPLRLDLQSQYIKTPIFLYNCPQLVRGGAVDGQVESVKFIFAN